MKKLVLFPGGVTLEMCEMLGRGLCKYLSVHSGTFSIINSAKGAMLVLDLKVKAEGREHSCHALIANHFTKPVIGDGFLAEKMAGCVCLCEAAEALPSYPMAA